MKTTKTNTATTATIAKAKTISLAEAADTLGLSVRHFARLRTAGNLLQSLRPIRREGTSALFAAPDVYAAKLLLDAHRHDRRSRNEDDTQIPIPVAAAPTATITKTTARKGNKAATQTGNNDTADIEAQATTANRRAVEARKATKKAGAERR